MTASSAGAVTEAVDHDYAFEDFTPSDPGERVKVLAPVARQLSLDRSDQ